MPAISLSQMIEALDEAARRQTQIAQGQRISRTRTESIERYDAERLRAAHGALARLRSSTAEIRAFVALSKEQQRAALAAVGAAP